MAIVNVKREDNNCVLALANNLFIRKGMKNERKTNDMEKKVKKKKNEIEKRTKGRW